MDMRPDKNRYYLQIAKDASARSTCLKRRYGAVIVKDDHIISTGYNGAPRGAVNCLDIGCPRMDVPNNTEYSTCRSVHAEANAIIHGTYSDMIGSTLYLYGFDVQHEKVVLDGEPCPMCKRMIINAQIEKVVVLDAQNTPKEMIVKDWTLPCAENLQNRKAACGCEAMYLDP